MDKLTKVEKKLQKIAFPKKKKYHYHVLDSGKRKRFKRGEHPSYEYSDSEEEYF